MKPLNNTQDPAPFKPVPFTILIESQEELDKLENIFNNHLLLEYLGIDGAPFRIHLRKLGSDMDNKHWPALVALFR